MVMEVLSIRSSAVSSLSLSLSQRFIAKPFVCGQLIKPLNTRTIHPNATKLKLVHFKPQASGATKLGSQPVETSSEDANQCDRNLIFIAGATGRVGSRTVRELLKLGFSVRAGVRSTQGAEPLVKSVQEMKLDEALPDGTQPIEKLQLVECDLEKKEQIGPALGKVATVICCIGASEKEVLDVTGPYRIDFQATKNLIDAATVAKVKHFILLTSLGTNKVGFPAAILNLFWGVLVWKRKAEEALLASGIPYTIVRPGGMERPTDSYKETHNIVLSTEDTLFGGQVSNLQVAELLAFMAKNPGLSYCKIVEVIAETTAPLTPMSDLLAKIPPQRAGAYQTEEPAASQEPEPVSKNIKMPSFPTETEAPLKPASTRPLSPYSAYEGLKPPTSPTPMPSGKEASFTTNETAEVESKSTTSNDARKTEPLGVTITSPLSPYVVYENLKPPSTPSPNPPSGYREIPSNSYTSAEVASKLPTRNDAAKNEDVNAVREERFQLPTCNHSPYYAYEDLKPPTSPSPSSPSISSPSTSTANGSPACVTDMLGNTVTAAKCRPLSPFPMYEQLKPPSSPTPSCPN